LREYMQIRDGLELGSGQSLKSRQNMGNRGTLYSYGEGLALQNPEFARIWDRLLSQEVEQ